MAWAYSVDLRERVVRAFDVGGKTDHEVAELFGIGEATVHRWKRQHRETGRLEPLPHRSGNPPRITLEQWVNRPEIPGGSEAWEGWSHGETEQVPGGGP